ncbi:hypothetical protein [Actinokineospora sp. NBRC 105648]|uniref:STAS domain-containing protein n=1 Tax=Actinokineospora sp. NBRC 105648 TaxID=3032206 RepID=UPI0024A1D883|nr:hypothetical protein [Actinokineospora sp. NBRC 105648]GLZ41121.1 hypothetical protein Acsp05_47450 [Actinokineospora sp. NBRC 105648]
MAQDHGGSGNSTPLLVNASKPRADWLLLTVIGEIDRSRVELLRDPLVAAMTGSHDRVILDLTRVGFLGA